ncbi:MAG: HXXEE domain-containing protein [Nakamurella sp.]
MHVNTYGRWPLVAATMLVPSWSAAVRGRRWLAKDGRWVAGLALPILLSHQTEEWVRPGGFLPFANQHLLGSDRPNWPLTERLAFHINVSVGWGSAVAGLLLWKKTAVPAAAVLWLEAGNAVMHIGMAARERRYNPGVVTVSLLMAPHAIAGARWIARSAPLSRRSRVATAAFGLSIGALPLAMKLRMRAARATNG